MKYLAVLVTLGLVVACGGSPSPAATPATVAAEQFGPGLVSHDGSVDEVMRDVTRVLSTDYKIAPSGEPGVVTTEWALHNDARWPGAETRVKVEVTADRVIVHVECRTAGASCARTVPDNVELAGLPQQLADAIVGGRDGERLLGMMRGFQKQVCACVDMPCVEDVEKQMMEWAMKNMDSFKNLQPTKAQDEEADRIEAAMDACKSKLELPSSPPVTNWPPAGSITGSEACDEYLETFDKVILTCKDKLGPALDAMKQSRDAQMEAFKTWATLDEASLQATLEAAESGCRSATDAIRQSAKSMGCKL